MSVPAELIPADEPERLAAVRRYEILDSPPDGAFERLTAVAARHFRVPIAIVTIVDRDRIWFKSAHGLDGVSEIGRDPGLCASAILQDEVWVVEEADRDPRTLANPLVAGEFGLRFYAGAPLTTRDGYNLGTLCVIDRIPREITADEAQTLVDLASVVVDELELRLAARQERQRLEETRADFVVTASHQLRTPLTAVLGAAKTLGRSRESLPDVEAQLVELIESQSERLQEIVEKILAAAELERGDVHLALEPHDPLTIAASALDAVRPLAGRRTVSLAPAAGPLPRVVADAVRLRQVLVNVLDNAIKYSPESSRVELRVEAAGGRVRFRVEDEGPGVPAGDRRRVFERFVRLDPHLHSGVGGTGLGLSIARDFVRRMGGAVEIADAPGGGAAFTVELPAAARS